MSVSPLLRAAHRRVVLNRIVGATAGLNLSTSLGMLPAQPMTISRISYHTPGLLVSYTELFSLFTLARGLPLNSVRLSLSSHPRPVIIYSSGVRLLFIVFLRAVLLYSCHGNLHGTFPLQRCRKEGFASTILLYGAGHWHSSTKCDLLIEPASMCFVLPVDWTLRTSKKHAKLYYGNPSKLNVTLSRNVISVFILIRLYIHINIQQVLTFPDGVVRKGLVYRIASTINSWN